MLVNCTVVPLALEMEMPLAVTWSMVAPSPVTRIEPLTWTLRTVTFIPEIARCFTLAFSRTCPVPSLVTDLSDLTPVAPVVDAEGLNAHGPPIGPGVNVVVLVVAGVLEEVVDGVAVLEQAATAATIARITVLGTHGGHARVPRPRRGTPVTVVPGRTMWGECRCGATQQGSAHGSSRPDPIR